MLVVADASLPLSNARRLRSALTPRGWGLLANAVLLGLVGVLVRIDELIPLAVAGAVLLVGAMVWVRVRPWRVEEHRVVTPARVALGTAARVDLTVINLDRRRSPVLSARDPFGGGRRGADFALAPVDPGASVRASYQLPTAKRGVFPLGPLEIRLCDPFGLASVERRRGSPFMVCVHPAFERIPPLGGGVGVAEGSSGNENHLHQRGEEFDGLREYQAGDDLRRVHWASSARHDLLMIRQDHDQEDPRTLLIGDLRDGVHTAATFERTLSVLASLADAAHRGGQSVRVVLTGGADSQWGTGPTHGLAILDLLAGATPHRTSHLSLSRLRWDHANDCTTIVVTTDEVSDSDLAPGPGAGRRDDVPVVVMIGREGAKPCVRSAGQRLVVVAHDATLAAAWRGR